MFFQLSGGEMFLPSQVQTAGMESIFRNAGELSSKDMVAPFWPALSMAGMSITDARSIVSVFRIIEESFMLT